MANRWVCLSDAEIKAIKEYVNPEGPYNYRKELLSAVKKLEDRQKRISISSAKGKGRALQQWVCQRIADLFGIEYNQSDDDCLIHAREMGQSGVDVILRGEVGKEFPFAIECKSTEQMSMLSFIQQAQANSKDGKEWMVVFKSRSIPSPVVIIGWDVLEKLYMGQIGMPKKDGWGEK